MSKMYYESFDILEQFMRDVFIKAGVGEEDAIVIAQVLIESDKRGIMSHGISRFKPIYIDRIETGQIDCTSNIEVVKDGLTTCVIDAHHGFGHVAGKKAMEMAIHKAKEYGMGMVAVRNSTHYGIAGYYASMAVEQGCIGITGTNARPSIAPTLGVEAMLGTNPLTFGIPSDEEFDFILDCATSTSQRGKVEVYDRLDKDIPCGWAINEDGSERTAIEGLLKDLENGNTAMTPLGGIGEEMAGYKGYGYGTVVEILSSALQGGRFLQSLSGIGSEGEKQKYGLGHFFIAIDVTDFTALEDFKKTVGDILRQLRASKKMPGQERIYTAGEKEYLYYQEHQKLGAPIDEKLQNMLVEIRNKYELYQYKFSFEYSHTVF